MPTHGDYHLINSQLPKRNLPRWKTWASLGDPPVRGHPHYIWYLKNPVVGDHVGITDDSMPSQPHTDIPYPTYKTSQRTWLARLCSLRLILFEDTIRYQWPQRTSRKQQSRHPLDCTNFCVCHLV